MNAAAIYQENAVTTQSSGKLVVLLYDGAITFLKNASDCMGQGNVEGRNHNIGRARDIIFELNTALNLERGGSLSQNLRSLYNFIWRTLGEANILNDKMKLDTVIEILADLRQSWKQIAG
jgi:flagellar protein FliS